MRSTWARLIHKVYEIDPLECPKRKGPMRLIELVARTRLAALFSSVDSIDDGGLTAYSIDGRDLYRKAAEYVDRILRGASASELPIERPTRLHRVLNLRTAKAQGIKLPQSLLVRADRVIE